MPLPIEPIVKILASPFSFLGKITWFVVGSKFGRNGLIIFLVLLAFLFTPIKEAFNQKDPRILIEPIVTRLGSGDNGIDQETDFVVELSNSGQLTAKKMVLSFFKIFGLFYFSFYILGFLFWKLGDFQDDTHNARNLIFAIVAVLLLQVLGSIYILSQDHAGDFSSDIKYIIGERSLIDTIKFLNPIKGILNFFGNIDIFLEPVAKFMERIYG